MNAPFSTEINRREMLRRCTAGFGTLGLAGLLGREQARAVGATGPHFAPKAKRVIFLFMNGGPSHIDTFDPKPALKKHEDTQPTGKIYKKPNSSGFMPSPFKFSRHGQSGIEVSESLPYLSQVIDECCVIRSMYTDVPNHEPALLQMHTGNVQPIRPSIGSWLQYGLGTLNDNLPGYVVLRPTNKIVVGPALWSNSFLPAQHQASSVITADMKVDKLVANVRNTKLTHREQREQLDLLNRLNQLHLAKRNNDLELNAQIKAMETAYRMQFEAMDTFDVEKESAATRDKYGRTRSPTHACSPGDWLRAASGTWACTTSTTAISLGTHTRIITLATPNFARTATRPQLPSFRISRSADCSRTRWSFGAANLGVPPTHNRRRKRTPDAITTARLSPCYSPGAVCAVA